jgi:hypothetical protein
MSREVKKRNRHKTSSLALDEAFGKAVANIHGADKMSREEYYEKYHPIVLHFFPLMRGSEDWRVVQGVWKTLMLT